MCDYDHITLFLCVSGTESSVMMIEGMKEGPLFIACACPSICGIVDGYGPWLLLFKCSSTSIELRHAIRSNKSSSSNCNDDDDDDKGNNNNNNSKAAATTTPKQWQTNLAANKKKRVVSAKMRFISCQSLSVSVGSFLLLWAPNSQLRMSLKNVLQYLVIFVSQQHYKLYNKQRAPVYCNT